MAVTPELLLPPVDLQYADVAEGSDLFHLLQGAFFLPESPQPRPFCLLPGICCVLLFDAAGETLLIGPRTQPLLLPPRTAALYGVVLRCGCGDWLWHDSAENLRNASTPLEPLLPGSEKLCAALTQADSPVRRSSLFARLAVLNGALNYRPLPLIHHCCRLMNERRGQIGVAELAQATGCSERHLNRLMHQKVGLGTKTACQLQQLALSLHTMLTANPRSLLHLAVNCGYFDQAHMSRQYRKYLTCSAGEIHRLTRSSL